MSARCSYCGGRSSAAPERILAEWGAVYSIPANHTACKHSVLSLSLSLSPRVSVETTTRSAARRREQKGKTTHE